MGLGAPADVLEQLDIQQSSHYWPRLASPTTSLRENAATSLVNPFVFNGQFGTSLADICYMSLANNPR
jgi:hypothetical protein